MRALLWYWALVEGPALVLASTHCLSMGWDGLWALLTLIRLGLTGSRSRGTDRCDSTEYRFTEHSKQTQNIVIHLHRNQFP